MGYSTKILVDSIDEPYVDLWGGSSFYFNIRILFFQGSVKIFARLSSIFIKDTIGNLRRSSFLFCALIYFRNHVHMVSPTVPALTLIDTAVCPTQHVIIAYSRLLCTY